MNTSPPPFLYLSFNVVIGSSVELLFLLRHLRIPNITITINISPNITPKIITSSLSYDLPLSPAFCDCVVIATGEEGNVGFCGVKLVACFKLVLIPALVIKLVVIDGTLCVTLFGSESVVITSIVVCCQVFPAELTLV